MTKKFSNKLYMREYRKKYPERVKEQSHKAYIKQKEKFAKLPEEVKDTYRLQLNEYYKERYEKSAYKWHKKNFKELKKDKVKYREVLDQQKPIAMKYYHTPKGQLKWIKAYCKLRSIPILITLEEIIELFKSPCIVCGKETKKVRKAIMEDDWVAGNMECFCGDCKKTRRKL
jgi:hypothetical protein